MMEIVNILLWVAAALWTILFVVGVLNALLVRNINHVRSPEPAAWPPVSYIVPARNEERGVGKAVRSFCSQDYPGPMEVIVINDRSTDRTGEILGALQKEFRHLTVLEGRDPPPGWLGKPNALEIGRGRATGEWLVVADGDSVHAPDLVRRAVAYAVHDKAAMLAVRPAHISEGILEAVLISSLNFFWFVVAPIFLVRHVRSPKIATGTGVFNLIRRDVVEACGGFACVKQVVLDDVEIATQVKRAGHDVAVTFGGTSLRHRMYDGALQTIQGFGKIIFPTIRSAPWILPLYLVLGFVISILPYIGLGIGLAAGWINIPAAISLVMMHLVFAGIAWRYGEPWYITFLNPLREAVWAWIFLRSFLVYRRSGLVWRGRSYQTSPR